LIVKLRFARGEDSNMFFQERGEDAFFSICFCSFNWNPFHRVRLRPCDILQKSSKK